MNTQVENKENTIIKKAIYGYKAYIKENSIPAERDSVYGNKLDSYLNAIDFAIYAALRGTDFKKGLHNEKKANEVKSRIVSQSKWTESYIKQKIRKAIEKNNEEINDEEVNFIYSYVIDKI